VLLAYEEAEWETDYEARRAKLTFVVVGGGPTGVELAGALKEIAAHAIPRDFRFIDTTTARVILIEAGSRLLPAMPEESSQSARKQLERMGVEVRLNCPVTDFREGEVELGEEVLPAANIIWAAGVRGAPLAQTLGVPLDKAGRVPVNPDLSLPGHPEVFVAGDLAHAVDSLTQKPVPGVAPAAIQMGQHVAKNIRSEIEAGEGKSKREPFQYRDKGTMATIGRCRAVASVKGAKAYIRYVEVLKKRRNAVGRTFCDAITFGSIGRGSDLAYSCPCYSCPNRLRSAVFTRFARSAQT
jgi:NADH dehydrogenase